MWVDRSEYVCAECRRVKIDCIRSADGAFIASSLVYLFELCSRWRTKSPSQKSSKFSINNLCIISGCILKWWLVTDNASVMMPSWLLLRLRPVLLCFGVYFPITIIISMFYPINISNIIIAQQFHAALQPRPLKKLLRWIIYGSPGCRFSWLEDIFCHN